MQLKKIFQIISAIIICHLAGVIGSFFTAGSVDTWYSTINKPSFNPPNWLFAPVWLTLYTLMGISAFLVWQKRSANPLAKSALLIFSIQLAFNAAWSVVFFGFHSIPGGMIVIFILLGLILWTTFIFNRISKPAAWMLLPYLLWVGFATILNAALFFLNI